MEQTNKILIGDVRDTISRLEDASIDCLNTSPPYFGLRNYAGNDKQIGREASGSDFIKSLANIIDAIKPKMKPTATMWINLGDTVDHGSQMLIPERFAIEMIDRGYKLVNQVVWYKPSCMPCSAKRRLGIDYEKVYLFALQDDYYFNMMKFPYKTATIKRAESFLKHDEANRKSISKFTDDNDGCQDGIAAQKRIFAKMNKMPPIGGKKHQENGIATYSGDTPEYKEGANCRSVWTINPSRNREKHFATQAPEISRRAIAMGCPKGGLVCDPFHGLGTTMKAAVDAGCSYVGCELNEEYVRAGIKKWNIQGATIE